MTCERVGPHYGVDASDDLFGLEPFGRPSTLISPFSLPFRPVLDLVLRLSCGFEIGCEYSLCEVLFFTCARFRS